MIGEKETKTLYECYQKKSAIFKMCCTLQLRHTEVAKRIISLASDKQLISFLNRKRTCIEFCAYIPWDRFVKIAWHLSPIKTNQILLAHQKKLADLSIPLLADLLIRPITREHSFFIGCDCASPEKQSTIWDCCKQAQARLDLLKAIDEKILKSAVTCWCDLAETYNSHFPKDPWRRSTISHSPGQIAEGYGSFIIGLCKTPDRPLKTWESSQKKVIENAIGNFNISEVIRNFFIYRGTEFNFSSMTEEQKEFRSYLEGLDKQKKTSS